MRLRQTLFVLVLAVACGDVSESPDTPTTTASTVEEIVPRSLASRIPPEERLHYLELFDVGHTLAAGDRIDLLGLFPIENSSANVLMNLLQNASVLDVRPASDPTLVAVGLSLLPDEVELLEVSAAGGKLSWLLRRADDVEVHTIRKVTLREVLEDLEVLQEKRQIRMKASDGTGPIAKSERAMWVQHGLPVDVLKPGNFVDVYGSFAPFDGTGTVTMSLLQRVQIVDLHQSHARVSVTPDEAEMLTVARHAGELTFVVRNTEDKEVSTITKKTLREVLEDLQVIQEKRQIRIRRKPKKHMRRDTIEIIAGDYDGATPSRGPVVAEPIGRESFVDYGTNEFTQTSADRFSTFAADVDTGSYTIMRRKLIDGMPVPPASVRVEEWVNYFTYDYAKPTEGAFAVSMEAAPSPFQTEPSFRLLRIGIQGKTIDAKARKPVHLTFLVDVSGSMSSPDKLGLVQKSLRHLVGALKSKDTVAIATYAGRTEILLQPTTVADRGKILRAVDQLSSGGGTAMNSGLANAYTLADAKFVRGHENRVIVLSDGDANVGRTSVDNMLETIAKGAKRGITLSTIGFGTGNYQDAAMEQLANKGNGNYYYVDSEREARRIFGDQLDGTMQTIAKDVKIQVEFDPTAVKQYRLIGYENRAIADKDFRNDAVDAGEIGAGHTVTALYELEMADINAPTVATVRVRHKLPHGSDKAAESAISLQGSQIAARLADTSDSFRFAAAVAAFAEIARQSPYAKPLNHEWVLEVAAGAAGTYGDRAEFLELVEAASKTR